MANHFLILALLVSCHALASTNAEEETGFVGPVDRKTLGLQRKHKLSHFRFYFHESFTPNNATTVTVVQPLPKYNGTTSFGSLGVTDNALTVRQDRNSKVVGRIEGFVAATSQSEFNLLAVLNFAFTQGKYNGSSIAVLGRNRLSLKVRELPIIGGTGLFRFATGYAETNTIFLDPKTRSTIEYNIYVSHY
ncbi:hypothetical protein Fmac_012114 [Flemingia macrophylla]|uniref:Dirigent protein n=1 Tax=Flemingia macrophylla TaxID=520843 RepID=A0ABD1MQ77_9FABA